jgi:hypothetical protein
MDLIHFGLSHVTTLTPSVQADEPHFKPRGLWVSDESTEDGWRAWCEAEEFNVDQLAVRTRVHLYPDHHVRVLTTADDIIRFTDDYGAWPSYMNESRWLLRQGYAIDWACVAKDYEGILITPYQWSMRLNQRCFWYYGFDCASGCIWDPAAVSMLEPL